VAQQRSQPGVVVLGSDFKALGVVRSLGRRGIPSVVIDNTPRSAWFSRYVTKRFVWSGPMESEKFVHFLLSLGKKHHLEGWVLFPLQDEVVELVARYHEQLAVLYQLATQNWEVVRWASDKRLTYGMAEEVGVPYPKTWYPKDENELAAMELPFPVIIKPALSTHLQYSVHVKAIPVADSEELLIQYRRVASIINPDEIMLQEIIPGTGVTQFSVAAFCKEGESLLTMTARRTRQYPIDYGLGSSFVEAIEVPQLYTYAEKLLRHMRVSGMIELEFKYDTRSDVYKLLDINLRPWGWHTLCIACGLDFPFIHYNDVLGYTPANILPRYGYQWVRLVTDIPAGIQEIRAGNLTPWAYLRSLMGKTVFSVFDWRDPLPAVGDLASVFVRSFKKLRGGDVHL
jgi:D-aspartate ligase